MPYQLFGFYRALLLNRGFHSKINYPGGSPPFFYGKNPLLPRSKKLFKYIF